MMKNARNSEEGTVGLQDDAKGGEVSATRKRKPAVTFRGGDGINDDAMTIAVSEDMPQRVFGTDCKELAESLLKQCLLPLSRAELGGDSRDSKALMLEIVEDIGPRDAVERLLAVQMATTHVALMRVGMKFAHADVMSQFEAFERAYNKLARTYTAQVEALRKHRNGGKQTVTVQHVNVGNGGQAIVGHVEAGGRGNNEK